MLERIKKLFNIKIKKEEQLPGEVIIERLFDTLSEDVIKLQIGEDLIPFGDKIVDMVRLLRVEIKNECGFIIPSVHIIDNTILQENEIEIYVSNELIDRIFVVPTKDGIQDELYDVLKTIIYDKLDVIFTNEIAEKYINTVQKNNCWLVWNITNILSVIDIKTILFDILCKGKSINNINYIFEKIGEYVLSDGNYRDCLKRYNLHEIANQISKSLQ